MQHVDQCPCLLKRFCVARCVDALPRLFHQTPLDLALHYGSVNAHAAVMATPAIRLPAKDLRAVAAAVFPSVPVRPPVVNVPPKAAAKPAKAGSPLAKRSPEFARHHIPVHTAAPAYAGMCIWCMRRCGFEGYPPVCIALNACVYIIGSLYRVTVSAASPDLPNQHQPRTARSSDDWQEIADDEVKSKGETEWHMGKKKSVSSVGQALKYVLPW